MPAPIMAIAAVVVLAAIAGGVWLVLGRDADSKTIPAESGIATARASYEAGDYADAESQLSDLIADDANDLEARRELALALVAQGKNEAAIEQYVAIAEVEPDDHESLSRMAALEQLLGMASEAIAHYEAAIEVSPEPSYYEALAPIYATVGEWTKCIDAWTTYLELTELDPVDEGKVHAAMSVAYDGMRDYDKAKAELEQALFLDPNNEQYKSRLEGYAN